MITEDQICLIRVKEERQITFERWLDLQGYSRVEWSAGLIGSLSLMFGPSTAAARGKAKSKMMQGLQQEERYKEYLRCVPLVKRTEHIQRRSAEDEVFNARLDVLNKREARREGVTYVQQQLPSDDNAPSSEAVQPISCDRLSQRLLL